MNISESLSWVLNSTQLSHSEHIVIQTLLYPVTTLWKVFCKLSSINIEYPNLGFNSSFLELFLLMSSSCIPPSHNTVWCKLHYSQFITKWNSLEMYLVCLVSLPLLSMYIADFLSIIMRCGCYGNRYVPLLKNALFSILEYAI